MPSGSKRKRHKIATHKRKNVLGKIDIRKSSEIIFIRRKDLL